MEAIDKKRILLIIACLCLASIVVEILLIGLQWRFSSNFFDVYFGFSDRRGIVFMNTAILRLIITIGLAVSYQILDKK